MLKWISDGFVKLPTYPTNLIISIFLHYSKFQQHEGSNRWKGNKDNLVHSSGGVDKPACVLWEAAGEVTLYGTTCQMLLKGGRFMRRDYESNSHHRLKDFLMYQLETNFFPQNIYVSCKIGGLIFFCIILNRKFAGGGKSKENGKSERKCSLTSQDKLMSAIFGGNSSVFWTCLCRYSFWYEVGGFRNSRQIPRSSCKKCPGW